ncbi:MAG TPA: diacylglycerol kinase family protein [Stellaceae bacterium]|nr:diacylglycerol kinase family protein [Stellaceae bacterium]
MPHHDRRRVLLIHNRNAGGGSHRRGDLVDLLECAGYGVAHADADDGLAGAMAAAAADLLVVAGGDGTVARVAALARPDGPPIAILPVGTANNIAHSLGLGRQPLDALVAGWRDARSRPFYPIDACGPWGRRRLIEGIGLGAFEAALATAPKAASLAEAREQIARMALAAPGEELLLQGGGEAIAGRFVLLEVMTIPWLGPHLSLAAADPFARGFAICVVEDDPSHRQALARWLVAPDAVGEAPVAVRFTARATITGTFCRVRLDGKLWAAEAAAEARIDLVGARDPLPFLVP